MTIDYTKYLSLLVPALEVAIADGVPGSRGVRLLSILLAIAQAFSPPPAVSMTQVESAGGKKAKVPVGKAATSLEVDRWPDDLSGPALLAWAEAQPLNIVVAAKPAKAKKEKDAGN